MAHAAFTAVGFTMLLVAKKVAFKSWRPFSTSPNPQIPLGIKRLGSLDTCFGCPVVCKHEDPTVRAAGRAIREA